MQFFHAGEYRCIVKSTTDELTVKSTLTVIGKYYLSLFLLCVQLFLLSIVMCSFAAEQVFPAACYLPPTKEEVNPFACIRLSVCLSVSKITQKRVRGFG